MGKFRFIGVCFQLVFGCTQLFGQSGFTDDFVDSNFTANPIWQGQPSKFEVNAFRQLQLNDVSANSPAYLSTESKVINQARWEFFVSLDFAPSGSNFSKVYLVSDQVDLSGNLQGYFVKIGGQSGTVDEVSLYRQEGNSEILLIDGIDGTVAEDPRLLVKVTKDSLANWELFIDTSTAFTGYISQGTAVDNQLSQSAYFGVYCRYTSTRSDKFIFDDFRVSGEVFQDTVPPQIIALEVLDSLSLELSFDEKLDAQSALDSLHYFVDRGVGVPVDVQFKGNDSTAVQITFGNSFVNGKEHLLNVTNIEDQSANKMVEDSLSFIFFIPVPADYRDIVINEFYPDFNPSNGLPAGEFIELYNASNKIFNLGEWSISDPVSTAQLDSFLLRPQEYLIICPTAMEGDFSAYATAMGVSSFPTLNNGGDDLFLRDQNNQLIDELRYDLSWYQDENKQSGGWTLEQINPFTECTGEENFSASLATIGGSPGVQNSIYDTQADTTSPTLTSAIVLSEDSILLNFSEAIDSGSISTANFSFSNSSSIAKVEPYFFNYQSLLLTLSVPLDSGVMITLGLNGLTDCPGNSIPSTTSVELVIPSVPSFRDVVINEIFADPDPQIGLPEGEFIEIYNASGKIFNLSNWKIGDPSTQSTLNDIIFLPGEYLIICPQANETAFRVFGTTFSPSSFPSLNNSGDQLTLKSADGKLIDMVYYEDNWYGDDLKKQGGYTLEQINPELACSGKFNFIGSSSESGGTPGQENSVYDNSADLISPNLLEAFVISEDSISLVFDENLDSNSIATASYNFSTPKVVDTVINRSIFSDQLLLILQSPLDSGELITLTIEGLTDCSGNLLQSNSISIALPQLEKPNDIVLNEVLFNPKTGGSDFVELYNRSEKVISLGNWMMGNENDGEIGSFQRISDLPYLIFPGEYVGLTEEVENIVFEYPFTRADRFIEVDRLPPYNNDEGVVVLLNQNSQIIDRIAYREEMHFTLLKEVKGVSLERLDPDRSSDDPGNFHSASESQGFATPGYENSQLFQKKEFEGSISIEPKTFSPDNDGYQDVLTINYQFGAPGFVANITIYDRNGRIVRELVNNELLGKSGSFSWDGISDQNEKARIGVYLILVDTFHPDGTQKTFKETAVLAGFLD